MIKAKVARHGRVRRVPDPLRLDEDHAVDHRETKRQTTPQDADSAGIAHVVRVVNVGSDGCVRIHGFEKRKWDGGTIANG